MAATWWPHWLSRYVSSSRMKWLEVFSILPRRSSESGKLIWFTKCWYGYRWIDGPAGEEPIKTERWLTAEEYVWYKLNEQ